MSCPSDAPDWMPAEALPLLGKQVVATTRGGWPHKGLLSRVHKRECPVSGSHEVTLVIGGLGIRWSVIAKVEPMPELPEADADRAPHEPTTRQSPRG